MKQIKDFIISQEDLPPTATSRQFKIIGEKAADFDIQVFNSSQQFYNFKSKTFSNGFDTSKNLRIKMSSNVFLGNINFPANGSGDTYTILIITSSDRNTKLSFGYGANSYSTSITQLNNTPLTFTPATANSASYQTFAITGAANITSTGVPSVPTTIVKDVSWIVKNTNSDAQGFGLRLIRQPIDTDWYFQTTETVDGAISSATQVKVDDLTDLTEGMVITAVSSGSLSGTPKITAIDTNTKTLTLSAAQTFSDGITLTIQARGSSVIQNAIGVGLTIGSFTATSTQLTKTVRTDPSGTTVNLNGTYGISGGSHVKIKGVNVNNNGTNTVQSVTASSSAGSMVMQLDQTGLKTGTTLYFKGSARIITIKGTITINEYPTSNRDINLNLDNFITLGTEL